MAMVTPAPATSRATTVNSMVPAAPVSGSWVMDLMFFTVLAVVLTKPHGSEVAVLARTAEPFS